VTAQAADLVLPTAMWVEKEGAYGNAEQSPRAADAHQRFLFTGQKTCIDCHKGIAHHLPDMRNVPGWQ
jgi:nitrate/TMAO reductase-like tetraheme cytochrome c subunit